MKHIVIVGLIFAVGACSTHQVRCHGPLRPINQPGHSAVPSAPKDPQP